MRKRILKIILCPVILLARLIYQLLSTLQRNTV